MCRVLAEVEDVTEDTALDLACKIVLHKQATP